MKFLNEITEDHAKKLFESKFWENMAPREITEFQLFTNRLCMPFKVFHEAIEKALNRPVYTHEMGLNYEGLVSEFNGEKSSPTLQEIIDLIPKDKRIIIA